MDSVLNKISRENNSNTIYIEEHKSCCNVRIGTLIFGIVLSVISALVLLATIAALFIHNFADTSTSSAVACRQHKMFFCFFFGTADFLTNVTMILAVFVFLLDFSMCAMLVNGTSERKSNQILTYFIYGNIKSVFGLLLGVLSVTDDQTVVQGAVTIVLSAVHFLMLPMVYKACAQIKSENNYGRLHNEAIRYPM